MSKRPSLFATPKPEAEPAAAVAVPPVSPANDQAAAAPVSKRPPSRTGKRVLSLYLDPLAWKQLRQLALDTGSTTQALGEEAVNLLFTKHGLNRSA